MMDCSGGFSNARRYTFLTGVMVIVAPKHLIIATMKELCTPHMSCLCVGLSGSTKSMPMPPEGTMASPWWWSLLDVRCG